MGSRDRRTKWFAEQIAINSTGYIPVIPTITTGNFVIQKADGTLEDAGKAPADLVTEDYVFFAGSL